MKKIVFIVCIMLATGLFNTTNAQNINININLDNQPAWGPTGYDYAGYYYFPDLNVYFDIDNSLFYYLSGSKWTSDRYLPSKYSKKDLYSLYKVVVNDNQPWLNNKNHKKEYSNYKNKKNQAVIRNSNDSRYSKSKNNDIAWSKNNKNNKNNKNTSNKNNNKNNSSNSNSNKNNSNKNPNKNNSNRNSTNNNRR
ncbi:MAG: hypothetical protein E6772_04175 [Dysgonomonas sp.]|nr:hypothetical protein [Dysgonomonas sp.]